ncbi:hypothetical protein EQ500_08960, partial [Lactobacillus sp. XV13L]|nr:hypothetical protein [Lactobacillus sp. XV13L]
MQLLAPMTSDLFIKTNFIDQTALEQVYHLTDDELLEQILALGAVGSSDWLKLRKKLQKDADQLYRPRGKKYELNQLLDKHQSLQAQLQQFDNENTKYHQLQAQLQELLQQEPDLQQQEEQLQQQVHQLEELQKRGALFQEFKALAHTATSPIAISATDITTYDNLQQSIAWNQQLVTNLQQQKNSSLNSQQQAQIAYFLQNQAQFQQLQQQQQELKFQSQYLKANIIPQQQQLQEQR